MKQKGNKEGKEREKGGKHDGAGRGGSVWIGFKEPTDRMGCGSAADRIHDEAARAMVQAVRN